MSSTVAMDSSPASILSRMRGEIVAARTAYPDVVHVEVRDRHGRLWRLASQDAEPPPDPGRLLGLHVRRAEIDPDSGGLRCSLSDGSSLQLQPDLAAQQTDGPPTWELLTPDGLALEFGPGLRWQIGAATAPARADRLGPTDRGRPVATIG